MSEDLRPEVQARVHAAYQAPSKAIARDMTLRVVENFDRGQPSAMACFRDVFEACIARRGLPVTHCSATRTMNLPERLAKNRAQVFTPFALGRLFLVRRRLLA